MTTKIPFNQLKPLHDLLADEIHAALRRVADSGWYILGPEVRAFEAEFAQLSRRYPRGRRRQRHRRD